MSASEGVPTGGDDDLEIEISPLGQSDDPAPDPTVDPSFQSSELDIASRTEQGSDRDVNEDAPFCCADSTNSVFRLLVGDGMGGAYCGEAASQQLSLAVQESPFQDGQSPEAWMDGVFELAAEKNLRSHRLDQGQH